MKTLCFLLGMVLSISTISAQSTHVPDDNFEQALIDLGYDDVLDDYVITTNISSIDSLDLEYKYIYSLTGIEDFTSLKKIILNHNKLTSLDLSNNIQLTYLTCYRNYITDLDISNNTELRWLGCANNPISELEISHLSHLEALYCANAQLTNLDVSNNDSLLALWCWNNQISTWIFQIMHYWN